MSAIEELRSQGPIDEFMASFGVAGGNPAIKDAILELDERLKRVEAIIASAQQFTCAPGDPAYGMSPADAIALMEKRA